MRRLLDYFLRWLARPKVRPWALMGPVLVLLISLPLLRPLRHPGQVSSDEQLRLATIRSIAEKGTLSIDPSVASPADLPALRLVYSDGKPHSDQPPMMSLLLAGVYLLLMKFGLTFQKNATMVPYLLTLIGVTIPVAASVGLLYRMGRVFELRRILRITLALACVVGTGLISYATVLNPHAPAAVLILCGAGSILHVASSRRPQFSGGWLAISGFCTALAATIDPPTVIFTLLFAACVPALRLRIVYRVGGLALFMVGASIPLLIHHQVCEASGTPWLPQSVLTDLYPSGAPVPVFESADELDDSGKTLWLTVGHYLTRTWSALLGDHGLLSHFPVIVIGLIGVTMVMHRHWTIVNKFLATASIVGALITVALFTLSRADFRQGMFATSWFIPALPMLLFWSGAWLRREHSRGSYALVAILLGISVLTSLMGATNPCPPKGYDTYTPFAALSSNFHHKHSIGEAP